MGYKTTEAKYQTCICGKECKGRAALANHGKKCPTERARSRAFLAADHALTDREFLSSLVSQSEADEYAGRHGVSLLDAYRAIAAVHCAMDQAAKSCTMRVSPNCDHDYGTTVKATMVNVVTGIEIERNLCVPCRELVQDSDVYAGYTELDGVK
jgi:hypothetical protein